MSTCPCGSPRLVALTLVGGLGAGGVQAPAVRTSVCECLHCGRRYVWDATTSKWCVVAYAPVSRWLGETAAGPVAQETV